MTNELYTQIESEGESKSDVTRNYEQGYDQGSSIGFIRGLVVGGTIAFATMIGTNIVNNYFSKSDVLSVQGTQNHQIHTKPFSQSRLLNKLEKQN